MLDKIYLVQGDVNRPQILATLTDANTGTIVDVTDATVVLKFRKVGDTVLTATIDGIIQDGAAGTVVFPMTEASLAGDAGDYEGEIEVTYAAGAGIQTVYDILKFKVRAQF